MAKAKIRTLTLGAATLDVFLRGEALAAKRDVRTSEYVEQFPLGDKIEVDDIVFSTGGGATNAAVTFARQGFEASTLIKVGSDLAGKQIIHSLENHQVKTAAAVTERRGNTGYSTILLTPRGERTILVYRGVSEMLKPTDFDWKHLKADWLYISSLAGNLKLLEHAVNWAASRGVKVALDPGSRELKRPRQLLRLIPKLTLLKGNREELGKIFNSEEPKTILRAGSKLCPFVVVTDGPGGSYATDGHFAYRAGMYKKVKVIDRTGAGDAFGSGLVAMLAHGRDLKMALTFGSANSTSVVRQVGSKAGILSRRPLLSRMKITSSRL